MVTRPSTPLDIVGNLIFWGCIFKSCTESIMNGGQDCYPCVGSTNVSQGFYWEVTWAAGVDWCLLLVIWTVGPLPSGALSSIVLYTLGPASHCATHPHGPHPHCAIYYQPNCAIDPPGPPSHDAIVSWPPSCAIDPHDPPPHDAIDPTGLPLHCAIHTCVPRSHCAIHLHGPPLHCAIYPPRPPLIVS